MFSSLFSIFFFLTYAIVMNNGFNQFTLHFCYRSCPTCNIMDSLGGVTCPVVYSGLLVEQADTLFSGARHNHS